jgi:hypothetical protein
MTRVGLIFLLVLSVMAVGCTSYYVVKDPASGKAFYTTDVQQEKSGVVKFRDEKSGANVTLQSSEVKEVSEKEFEAGLKAATPPPAPSTPAPK